MPELPDIEAYLHALRNAVIEKKVTGLNVRSPFVVRTVEPPIEAVVDKVVSSLSRIGKRIVFSFEDDLHMVVHLMIAGRLRWRPPGAKLPGRRGLAAFDFEHGTLLLTEEGKKKRASIHMVKGADSLALLDPGGVEVMGIDEAVFAGRLRGVSHTLKRALTDPHVFSGIGNAYSDEILFAARLSPFRRTTQLSDEDISGLHTALQETLGTWRDRLVAEAGDAFPEKVTAFRPEMAVHGKFGEPCVVCGTPIQRIRYADRECNYCASCQTDGKVLADRSLSRLLKDDWPRSIDELERVPPLLGKSPKDS